MTLKITMANGIRKIEATVSGNHIECVEDRVIHMAETCGDIDDRTAKMIGIIRYISPMVFRGCHSPQEIAIAALAHHGHDFAAGLGNTVEMLPSGKADRIFNLHITL